ncbi:uncharacterized PE-PGRS family protein PE_PGRS10-like [Belonocnema kinseyi]|uniref:uncharacterized PE-PGRS family protein PE_PGRS10-like n=1 Tax=Belonocnema kinseyi TaxID=2817044 RepID=UPI00143D089E|nr:uncharacterized PE-PGRS family protein PE_PGRS10-like [Belonocnema kinseyi]
MRPREDEEENSEISPGDGSGTAEATRPSLSPIFPKTPSHRPNSSLENSKGTHRSEGPVPVLPSDTAGPPIPPGDSTGVGGPGARNGEKQGGPHRSDTGGETGSGGSTRADYSTGAGYPAGAGGSAGGSSESESTRGSGGSGGTGDTAGAGGDPGSVRPPSRPKGRPRRQTLGIQISQLVRRRGTGQPRKLQRSNADGSFRPEKDREEEKGPCRSARLRRK